MPIISVIKGLLAKTKMNDLEQKKIKKYIYSAENRENPLVPIDTTRNK
jgi:hypothetical protein